MRGAREEAHTQQQQQQQQQQPSGFVYIFHILVHPSSRPSNEVEVHYSPRDGCNN